MFFVSSLFELIRIYPISISIWLITWNKSLFEHVSAIEIFERFLSSETSFNCYYRNLLTV